MVTYPSPAAPLCAVEDVVKRFGATLALDHVDLEVPQGTVFGLLGPNGAGKTTLGRVLATLLRADSGRAELLGRDVVREAPAVRELLGLTGQYRDRSQDADTSGTLRPGARRILWPWLRIYSR